MVILSYSPQKAICGNTPDIKVDNLPYESYKGKDAQLEAAVQYLIKLNKEQPVATPPIPKYPI
jgi:tricorn protease